MTPSIFRWKAISALAATLLVIGALWALFGDWIVRRGIESIGSEVFGAEVDLASLRIRETRAAIEMRGLQITSPFDSTKNIIAADNIVFSLEPLPLLEKKFIVNRLTLTGLTFNTTRARPGRRYGSKNNIASRLRAETGAWVEKVKVPLLSLTPIDTIKSIILDPSSLATLKAVDQLTKRADSVKGAFQKSFDDLQLQALLDTTQALVKRLQTVKPGATGIAEAAQSIQSAKKSIDQIDQAKKRIASLEQSAHAAAALLTNGVQSVDSARRSDYEFAKGLLKLPKLEAPNIGAALFGPVSIARFQQAIYWGRMAQEYIPPGLQPWQRPGPARARRAGLTYSFPREHTDPKLLLKQGQLSFALGGDTETSAFTATVTGLTSEPELYGQPATLRATGATTGKHAISAEVGAMLDHTRSPTHDSARVRLGGIEIPGIDLPGLPFGVEPGRGTSELTIEIEGSQLTGRWTMRTNEAKWSVVPAKAQSLNTLEGAMWRVLSGLTDLDVTAELSGDIASPQLSVSSNVDQQVAARLRAIVGEEIAKAEAKARAAVDKLVADKVAPIAKQVAGVTSLLDTRLGGSKTQLDQVQKQLNEQIKRLSGPAGLFQLPKITP
jgi:uncharacterized protein (TIGR03545 family)